tara:strand:- start:3046 stop:3240 length:195 start_codon:yes stop_codon:yes gene_type:complete
MITDYLRWLRIPMIKYYKVEPVEPIAKEFPLEKHGEPESEKEEAPEEPSKDQPVEKRKRLSIWV